MTPWMGRDAMEGLAAPALELAGAAGVEVTVERTAAALTRFAASSIHQNVATEDVVVSVRVATDDGRIGVVGASTDDPAEVARVAHEALAVARVSPVDPTFAGFAPPGAVRDVPLDDATAGATPADRAATVRALLAEVPGPFEAAGAYATAAAELAVFTSAGQRAYAPLSSATLSTVVTGPSSSGWAEAGGRSADDVDAGGVAQRALGKARAGASPREVEEGDWAVVLEPPAVATLVQFLAYLGFGARAVAEERSFVSGQLGQRLFDPSVTIVDDAAAPGALGYAVDWEGTPKQRVTLVDSGVVAGVVHDRATAAAAGTTSTGHALPAPSALGPIPLHPVLVPGDGGTVDDLVGATERGLLVTRFHYTNVVHPLRVILTGMTRDGTFLVENGRVVAPVRNLRFTCSLLDVLAQVSAVGTQTGYGTELFGGGAPFPALRLPAFSFTGSTTFG